MLLTSSLLDPFWCMQELERFKKAGNEAFSAGKYAEAIEQYTEGAAPPRFDPAASGLARCPVPSYPLACAAHAEVSLPLLSAALNVDPDNGDINLTLYTNRATAKSKSGNHIEAIADCDKALAVQPRHMKALLRRAACKMELEQWKGAIADYEEAMGYEPDDASIKQVPRAFLADRSNPRKGSPE